MSDENTAMTVDELLAELKELSWLGKGGYTVSVNDLTIAKILPEVVVSGKRKLAIFTGKPREKV